MEDIKNFISACLVIKDEEDCLDRCLKSIQTLVDEIILIHDGPCKDRSLEIANNYKARIFVREFAGLPAIHRPFSFEQAKGEWILYIDADEVVTDELRLEVRKLVQAPEVDAYNVNFPIYECGIKIERGPYKKSLRPFLFRKSKLYLVALMDLGPMTYGRTVERWDLTLYHSRDQSKTTWHYFRTRLRQVWELQGDRLMDWKNAPMFNVNASDSENPLICRVKSFVSHPVYYTLKEASYDFYWRVRHGLLWSNFFSYRLFLSHTLIKFMMMFHFIRKKNRCFFYQ